MTPTIYMAKALRALSSARVLLNCGDGEGACNRAYYAMFDAARAALMAADVYTAEVEIKTKTHRGLIGAFGEYLVQSGLVALEFGSALNKVERLRRLADYTGEPVSFDRAGWAVAQAESFVTQMRLSFMGSPN